MPKRLKRDDGLDPVIGDTLTVPVIITGVPVGVTPAKLYFTIKKNPNDADDAPTTRQKILTTGLTVTTVGDVRTLTASVTLTKAETAGFLAGKTYYWDVQVVTSDGAVVTPIPDGEVEFQKGRTAATS